MATILSIDETTGLQLNDTTLALPTQLNSDLVALLGSSYASTIIEKARVADALTFGANTIDVAFTNSSGGALSQVDSGLITIDGRKIFLDTYSGDNNLVIGRAANADGTYNASGAIALVAYLDTNGTTGDTNATKANLVVLEFTSLQHYLNTDPANADFNNFNDFVSLAGKLNVTVTNPISFDATKAPSGSSLFVAYGDGTPLPTEVGVIVTAVGAVTSGNISGGNVVKASQAGASLGGATFGVNSQHFDGPGGSGGANGDAAYFTFVKGLATNLTVPNLNQNESDVEANIGFTQLFGATKVSFVVCQMQGQTFATLKISALVASVQDTGATTAISDDTPFTGNVYVDNQDVNTLVDIDTVTIKRGTNVWTFVDGQAKPAGAPANLNVDFSGDGGLSALISGAAEGDKITYESNTEHDRLLIAAPGNAVASLNTAFDIGALQIESGGLTTTPLQDINFYDDGPDANGTAVSATVDEDGAPLLADANPGGFGDNGSAGSSATGSIAGIFNAGRDGLKEFSLSTDTSGLASNLKSQGGTVVYNVTGNKLTAYVEVTGAGYNATDDREVFTLELSGTNNSTYTFTMIDQLDHALTNDPSTVATETSFEDELALNLGSVLRVSDRDNDTKIADPTDLAISVDDDSPVINTADSDNDLTFINADLSGTGDFDYSIGVDDRDSYSATNTDLLLTLTGGSVGSGANSAITNRSVTWQSEDDDEAVFDFAFRYVSNPLTNTTTDATGSIVFDKDAGTYTLTLDNPILSFSVLSLNTALGFTGYVENTDTVDSSQPNVSVARLAENFFVQFRADEEPSGNGDDKAGENANIDAVPVGTVWDPDDQPANDDAFTQGEIFLSSNTWPSVNNSTAGIASDTIQYGEVLDFNFFNADPKGLTAPAASTKATSGTIFIEFDGLDNGEDLVVLLKLVDKADPNNTTTIPVIVQYDDIFHKQQANQIPAAFGFTGTLDNNDGLVVIEANDYSFLPGSTGGWTIQGAQVIASTEGISGQGIDLVRAIGSLGGSSTLVPFNSGPNAKDSGNANGGTWDGDVFKIVNIGFVAEVTPDAQLTFGIKVVDFDGDTTGSQTLTIDIDSGTSSALATATAGFAGMDSITELSTFDLARISSDTLFF